MNVAAIVMTTRLTGAALFDRVWIIAKDAIAQVDVLSIRLAVKLPSLSRVNEGTSVAS